MFDSFAQKDTGHELLAEILLAAGYYHSNLLILLTFLTFSMILESEIDCRIVIRLTKSSIEAATS